MRFNFELQRIGSLLTQFDINHVCRRLMSELGLRYPHYAFASFAYGLDLRWKSSKRSLLLLLLFQTHVLVAICLKQLFV